MTVKSFFVGLNVPSCTFHACWVVLRQYAVTCIQATERFEAIYPAVKEVALAVSPGSKAMKQLTQQIMPFAIKAAGEGNSAKLE